MYLEKVCKFVSAFDEKRCYLNEYEKFNLDLILINGYKSESKV